MSFADELAAAQGIFDETFGRSYSIEPFGKADPNGRPGPDPTRASAIFVGIPSEVHSRMGAENGPSQFDVTRGGHTTARLQINLVASALPYRPRLGDRVTDVVDGTLFVIAEVRVEGDGRIALDVNALARP